MKHSGVIELEPYACVKHSGEFCYRVRALCMCELKKWSEGGKVMFVNECW